MPPPRPFPATCTASACGGKTSAPRPFSATRTASACVGNTFEPISKASHFRYCQLHTPSEILSTASSYRVSFWLVVCCVVTLWINTLRAGQIRSRTTRGRIKIGARRRIYSNTVSKRLYIRQCDCSGWPPAAQTICVYSHARRTTEVRRAQMRLTCASISVMVEKTILWPLYDPGLSTPVT